MPFHNGAVTAPLWHPAGITRRQMALDGTRTAQYMVPRQHLTAPGQHYMVPRQCQTVLEGAWTALDGARWHLTAPGQHYMVPRQHLTAPGQC